MVDFEDLSKERNTSALDLEGSSILKMPREYQPQIFQAAVENEVDQHHNEYEFEEGDCVFLRLHLYKYRSLKDKGVEKPGPKYHVPYKFL